MAVKFKVGLTGGLASGKSTVAQFFSRLGVEIIDTDVLAKELTEPNTESFSKIIEYFGKNYLTTSGHLDRGKLRKRVFEQHKDKQWLEDLLHPLIWQRVNKLVDSSKAEYVIIVIPLLVETDSVHTVDRVLVVDLAETLQIERALGRDDCSEAVIKAIIDSQAKREERLKSADDVIVNDRDQLELKKVANALHKQYLKMAKKIVSDK